MAKKMIRIKNYDCINNIFDG